jgi:hypothetical protein
MHNGGIADFPLIKRKLQAGLSDEVFNVVQGNTGGFSLQFETLNFTNGHRYGRLRMGIRIIPVQGSATS